MANIGCLLRDTQVIEDLKVLFQTIAANNISQGRAFSIQDAYSFVQKNKLEIDLETTASVYEDVFNLNDGNFSTQQEVDDIVGRTFDRTLSNLISVPNQSTQMVGEQSLGKAVATKMANMFANAQMADNRTKSLMKTMQDAFEKAVQSVAKKELKKGQHSQSRNFVEILSDVFNLENIGIRTLSGAINNMNSVRAEFAKEIGKYVDGMIQNGASQTQIDQFKIYADKLIDKAEQILLTQKEAQQVVKEALIEGGANREVTKNGETTRVLDWKKLTNGIGSPSYLRDNVSEILRQKGFDDSQIDAINNALENEYISLRAKIIQNASKDLERRNNLTSHEQTIAAQRLAQLYSYGLFNANPNTYENVLNKVFGISEIDQESWGRLRELGGALESLYAIKIGGVGVDNNMLKTALNSINEQVGAIISDNRRSKSAMLRAAMAIRTVVDSSLRFVLTGLKNYVLQNPISGKMAKINAQIRAKVGGTTTFELNKQNREFLRAVFRDMVLNGGLHYGDTNTTFINRGDLDRFVNELSDSKLYHAVMGTIIGRTGLDAMDSRFKASITHIYLIENLVKILTNPTNPNRMTKAEAIRYVSEQMTGRSFAEAKQMAKATIDKINSNSNIPILDNSEDFITRFANDLVLGQLIAGGAITQEQLDAAYYAAYRVAGRDLGHVPNNFISWGITSLSEKLENIISKSEKRGDYKTAASWMLALIVFKSVMNPFVGGSTNWIFLKAEKSGIGLVTGGLKKIIGSKKNIDLTSEADMEELKDSLYKDMIATSQMYRGAIGGAASLVTYAAMAAAIRAVFGGDDDEAKKAFNKWRMENRWLTRYTDELTSEWLLLDLAVRESKVDNYLVNYLNLSDRYNAKDLILRAVGKFQKGDVSEAWGLLGEAVGTKVNAPVPGWRMVRDVIELGKGFFGVTDGQKRLEELRNSEAYRKMNQEAKNKAEKEAMYSYTQSRSFWQGLLKNGFFEYIGVEVNPDYTLDALPGVSGRSLERLKDLGIKNMDDLRKYRNRLDYLKYVDSKGANRRIFDKKQVQEIKRIFAEMDAKK